MHAPSSTLTFVCHEEDGAFWCESPDLPGFSAADRTLPGLLHRVAFAIADTGVR